jgi:putative transposase
MSSNGISRRGTLWGERFKSCIVENGETLINCLAYIDLNPIRAGLVTRPEDYRWNSLGYHFQQNNKDDFLSLDFGMIEFGVMDEKERLRRYRRYVYEAGAVAHPGKRGAGVINEGILEKERAHNFNVDKVGRRTGRAISRTRASSAPRPSSLKTTCGLSIFAYRNTRKNRNR